MRPAIYGAVLLAAIAAAIASWHLPKVGLAPGTFREVSDVEFAVMREEAVRLVRGSVVQDARHVGERYFDGSCYRVPVMLVDHFLEQLVIGGVCGYGH